MDHSIKHIWKPERKEWITFWILGVPFITVINLLLFDYRLFSTVYFFFAAFISVGSFIFISWYFHVTSMHLLRQWMPAFKHTVLRIFLLAIIHVSMITLSMVCIFYGFDTVHFLGYYLEEDQFTKSLVLSCGLILIATTIWEGDYIIEKWKNSLEEKSRFEQLNLQNEFDTLKSQVNPHFLFNCFNTLSSLISEDPEKAEIFLDELSKVYRYLLSNNESSLSSVKDEIRFIESYFNLLRTRYGEAIQLFIEVDKKYDSYFLPSLSLQLLLENAVKHNVVSRDKPLSIEIFSLAGGKLAVNNNLQARMIKAPSTNVGLQNIRSKYELLGQPGFMIMEDGKSYTVVLPLIWQQSNEASRWTNENLNFLNTSLNILQ